MKTLLSTAVWFSLCLLSAPPVLADEETEEPPGPDLQADEGEDLASLAAAPAPMPESGALLRDVVAGFPREPLVIRGELLVRKRRGVETARHPFLLSAHWGGTPATARYSIMDASGRILEQMRVSRESDGTPRLDYLKGDPPARSGLPSLFDPIQDTDISWMDLTLSFLWWPGGTVVGRERVRGYDCYVVDLPAPVAARPAGEAQAYARVRLWIGEKMHVLLQAEGYGADGEPRRRLWVRSCKKINDRWMIKDMEIQSYPAVRRTKLSIQEVEISDPP